MGTPDTTGQTISSTYTNRNVNVPTLTLQNEITNSLNKMRKDLGLATTRNAYPWWTYFLAALTYFPEGANVVDVEELLNGCDIYSNLKTAPTLLKRSIKQVGPDRVQREYTAKLLKVVKNTKLQYDDPYDPSSPQVVAHKELFGKNPSFSGMFVRSGRPPIHFRFKNHTTARTKLIEMYPTTQYLFDQIDSVLNNG